MTSPEDLFGEDPVQTVAWRLSGEGGQCTTTTTCARGRRVLHVPDGLRRPSRCRCRLNVMLVLLSTLSGWGAGVVVDLT
jgi:hypothetical protein